MISVMINIFFVDERIVNNPQETSFTFGKAVGIVKTSQAAAGKIREPL